MSIFMWRIAFGCGAQHGARMAKVCIAFMLSFVIETPAKHKGA